MTAPKHAFLESRDAFGAFVSAWESGRLPRSQWTHAAHVAIGASYSVRFGIEALDHLRVGIKSYNEAVGTLNGEESGYHETLTRFWWEVLANFVCQMQDPYLAAQIAVSKFGDCCDLTRNTTVLMLSTAEKHGGHGCHRTEGPSLRSDY